MESKEEKERGAREKTKEDQVIKDHLANDAKKKAIQEKLNSTSYHDRYGMQDQF